MTGIIETPWIGSSKLLTSFVISTEVPLIAGTRLSNTSARAPADIGNARPSRGRFSLVVDIVGHGYPLVRLAVSPLTSPEFSQVVALEAESRPVKWAVA